MAELSPRDAIAQLIDVMKLVADDAVVIAEAKKRLYDAYVAQGFTPAQALELVLPRQGSLF